MSTGKRRSSTMVCIGTSCCPPRVATGARGPEACLLRGPPASAAEAARVILDGVKADRWRILIGTDAHLMDRMVREDPEHAYEEPFFARFAAAAGWHPGR